jgi:4-azaleucine resistance transporter AzlC
MTAPSGVAPPIASVELAVLRRRLVVDSVAITLSAGAFAIVYGLAARSAGFSLVEALAMSVFVLAGASQFAAVGLVAGGVAWPAIVLLTFLLNARHLLYSAALAPWFRGRGLPFRAASAHVLVDETFALGLAHFRRAGRFDAGGYWIAAALVCVPWIGATVLGFVGGQALPDPARLALDVVFPAAMAGLAVALVAGRRELSAALAGVAIAVAAALLTQPAVGIVAGGLLGPLVGFLVPEANRAPIDEAGRVAPAEVAETLPETTEPPAERLL